MTEPTIVCPNCKTEIRLTESLAAPLVEATRKEFEERLAAKDAEAARREAGFKQREADLAQAKETLEAQVAERVESQRVKIVAEEAAKAQARLDAELQTRQTEIDDLQEQLKQRNEKVAALQKAQAKLTRDRQELEDAKLEFDSTVAEKVREGKEKLLAEAERKARLALQDEVAAHQKQCQDLEQTVQTQRAKLQEAQTAQADLLKKQRELEDAKAELELNIQKGIQQGLEATRAQARKEAEETLNLQLIEKQQTIDGMKAQIENLKRKAEQGSQQLHGEAYELDLEQRLSEHFPQDTVSPVPKGQFGGDTLQTVYNSLNMACGTILWECKRTKTWGGDWLAKLRNDQRMAKAEVAVIVSQALPKECDTFALLDGIWVTSHHCAIPVAVALRQSLIELAMLRQSREGQETKMEAVYEYLTGPRFRQRVEAIIEAFSTMQDDFAKEKRAIQAQWAKREKQLEKVLTATVGMYGDLQGISGQAIKEIESLEVLALAADPTLEL